MKIRNTTLAVSGLLTGMLLFGSYLIAADSAKPAKSDPALGLKAALAHLDKAQKAIEAGDKKAAIAALAGAREKVTAVYESIKRPDVVNNKCPIMGGKVDPKKVPDNLYRKFRGQGVGFCCAGCPHAWDKLSDEDKAKKLAAVKTK